MGLRQLKKQQTRQQIVKAAEKLFARKGYERVAMVDVAREAEVSEQTVYNYFPTKDRLVLDLEEELHQRLPQLIRERPRGTTPAGALRAEIMAMVDAVAALPDRRATGGLGYLAAISPTVRRLSLEMTERLADAMARAISESRGGPPPAVAKLQAVALAWVVQTMTDETGRRLLAGQRHAQIAAELRPTVADLIDSLDVWFKKSSS